MLTHTKRTFPPLLVLPMIALVLSGCHHKGGSAAGGHAPGGASFGPPPLLVDAMTVKRGNITEKQNVTGNIEALEDSTISAQVSARVQAVYVREGDTVQAGEVLVQQDPSSLEATVNVAQANVASAESTLAQNFTNYNIQVIQAKQNIQNAQAAVQAALFNYSKEKEGSRPPQILEAKSTVEQAQATLDNAASTLQRDKYLYSQGALDAADLQTAQTNYTVADEQYTNSQAGLALTEQGNYAQDIATAQQQVKEAQSNLVNQIANRKQVLLHKQEIQAAQDAVAAAKATLRYDQEQVGFTTIKAPFSGIVAARDAQPGQVVSAGTALLEVINVSTAYFLPTISQEFFTDVHVGDLIKVRSDALPGKVFDGHVAAIYPSTNTSTREFSLRVDIPNPSNDLRPGMFARGELITGHQNNVIVIPASALLAQQQTGLAINTTSTGRATGTTSMPDQQVMLIGSGNQVIAQPVTVGLISRGKAEITSGLKPGDRVITTGAGLAQPGQKVRIQGQTGSGSQSSPSMSGG